VKSLHVCNAKIHEPPKTSETGLKKRSESLHTCTAVNGDYTESSGVKLFHRAVNTFFRHEFSFKFERLSYLYMVVSAFTVHVFCTPQEI
jgi:hypothetical protein